MITEIMSKDGGSKVVIINRRKAVRERCLNCKCWQVGEVSECQERDCHLHPFRTGRAGRVRRTGQGR